MTREAPQWTEPYVGIPFADLGRDRAGADCYGLNRLVALEQDGVDLPDFGNLYLSSDNRPAIHRLIVAELERANSLWTEVPWEQRRPRDWLLYRRGEFAAHLGLVGDDHWALHTLRGVGSTCEAFTSLGLSQRYTGLGVFRLNPDRITS